MDKARNALDSITWYNGLAPVVFSWIWLKKKNGYCVSCPNRYGAPDDWAESYISQLQVFWMYAVETFGECGTSPRFGWITDVTGFRKWILDITETWRGSEEYDGPEKYRHSWAEEVRDDEP